MYIIRTDIMQYWNGESWVSKKDAIKYVFPDAFGIKNAVQEKYPKLIIQLHWQHD
jgi:hypothetical protein